MRLSALRFLAASSLLLALAAHAAERPRYGGVLRVDTRQGWEQAGLRRLVIENLTTAGDTGQPAAQLATTWESQNEGRRWQFWLRRGVRFHDGTLLTPAEVVKDLQARRCNSSCPWSAARAVGDSVVLEFSQGRPHFAAEVALPQYGIERTGADSVLIGTGPFRWSEYRQSSATTVLTAFDDYWGGRPFVDAIEVAGERSPRDQALDLESGRADVVEGSPEQIRRWQQQRMRLLTSQPVELIVLALRTDKPALQDVRLRQALALAIDRDAIHNVVLQKQGEVAAGFLPNWISGYAFLLPHARDLGRAQQLRAQLGNVPPLTIGVSGSDATLQLIAERIALNARDAGLMLAPAGGARNADLFVERVPLETVNPFAALESMRAFLGGAPDPAPDSLSQLYEDEQQGLGQFLSVPLAWVTRAYAVGTRVHDLQQTAAGQLRLERAWADAEARNR